MLCHQTTPVSTFTGTQIAPTIGLLPILRAGLGMTDALLSLVSVVGGHGTNIQVGFFSLCFSSLWRKCII